MPIRVHAVSSENVATAARPPATRPSKVLQRNAPRPSSTTNPTASTTPPDFQFPTSEANPPSTIRAAYSTTAPGPPLPLATGAWNPAYHAT